MGQPVGVRVPPSAPKLILPFIAIDSGGFSFLESMKREESDQPNTVIGGLNLSWISSALRPDVKLPCSCRASERSS